MIRFDHTDSGNAERLAALHKGSFRYVVKWKQFIVWTGTEWTVDECGIEMRKLAKDAVAAIRADAKAERDPKRSKLVLKWYAKSRSKFAREAMISLAQAEDGVGIAHERLDKDLYLFNCKNGTIDLKTGKLRRHRAEDLLTRTVPVKYDPDARCPRWEKFLKSVLPDPAVREFLQRFVGYCLTGEVTERLFVVLHGGGRNGKSVLLKMLQYVLGPYAAAAPPGLLMAKKNESHPTEIAGLFGTRLAVASEVKKGRVFDEELVKRLTGNDRLSARRMHEDFWEFDPTHKLIIAANHKPRVKDASDSFWDRIALIPFHVRVEDNKVDRGLVEKLRAELPGIFAWGVRGCEMWRKAGLSRPESVVEATRAYRHDEDRVGQFFDYRLDFTDITQKATNHDIKRASVTWCKEIGMAYPFSDRDLAERLTEKGCTREKNIGKEKERGWRGVRVVLLREIAGRQETVIDTGSPISRIHAHGQKLVN